MRWLRWLRWTLLVVAVLRGAGIRRRPGGRCARACRSSTARRAPGARRAKPPSSAMRAASRSSPPPRAPISPSPPATRTARTASSRWICRAAWRRANCRSCSARSRVKQDRRTRRFGFRAVARRVIEAAPADERAIIEAYARGVNAGLAQPARAALGIPAAARRAARLAAGRFGAGRALDVVAAAIRHVSATRSTAAGSSAPRPRRSDAAARACAHRLRLRRPLATGTRLTIPPRRRACRRRAPTPRACSRSPFPAQLRFAGAGGRSRRARRPRPAATTGRWPACTRAPAWRWSPTTCISISACRRCGIRRDCASPAIPPSTSPASRCPARPRWPRAPTARWPGDSPTATAISPTCAGASARAPDYGVRREHIAVKGADDVEVTYRDVGAGVVLDGEEYADDVASGECLQVGVARDAARGHELRACSASRRARSIDDVLALAPRVGIPGQNLVVGDSRGRIAWTLLGRVPRTAGPDRLFGALEYRDADGSSAHRRSAGRPPVDRESARGRGRARSRAGRRRGGRRRRRLRHRRARAADPRRSAEARASGHRGGHAGDPARFARVVPGALARSAAGAHRRRRDARCAAAPRIPRAGQRLEGAKPAPDAVGLPAGARVPRQHARRAVAQPRAQGC